MAPPSRRFHVVPADNTIPIEEFDGFEVAPRVPDLSEQRHAVPKSKEEPVEATSAVHRVFKMTELIEMVLLQDVIRFNNLFVIQRVSKGLRDVIDGSHKLQVKMFLAHSTRDTMKPRFRGSNKRLGTKDGAPLFNPLMGITLALDKPPEQFDVFRQFNFHLLRYESDPSRQKSYAVTIGPITGAAEKALKPQLRGSWEKMKIFRIPLGLKFYHGTVELCDLFLAEEDAIMSNLFSKLSAWHGQLRNADLEHLGFESNPMVLVTFPGTNSPASS